MSNGLDDRLARLALEMGEPSADATARVRRVVTAAPASSSPRRMRSAVRAFGRPVRIAAAVAGVALIAGVLAVLVVVTPDEAPAPASAGLRPPTPAGPVTECLETRLMIPCVASTEAVRASTPALARAPWLYGRPGRLARLSDSPPRPSLVFPPGVTYGQALDSLLTWVTLTGSLPKGAVLGPSLPDGVVLLRPSGPSQGIAVDLRAPFGYEPGSGLVQAPFYTGAPASRPEGAPRELWPRGVRVTVPTLPDCMVIPDRAAPPVACGRQDRPVVGRRQPAGVTPLPRVEVKGVDVLDVRLRAPADRPPAPAMELPVLRRGRGDTATAGTLDLADLRGRVVVLSFFASWCEPCVNQASAIRSVARRYRGADDVVVLGIAVTDRTSDTLRFLDRHRLPITALGDPDGSATAPFGGPGLPKTILLDRQGRVARRIAGQLVTSKQVTLPVDELRAESP